MLVSGIRPPQPLPTTYLLNMRAQLKNVTYEVTKRNIAVRFTYNCNQLPLAISNLQAFKYI